MWNKVKPILVVSLWTVLSLSLITILGFVDVTVKNIPCNGINISIDRSNGCLFVNESSIRERFEQMGYVDSNNLCHYNLNHMESMLELMPAVRNAEVYSTIHGKINVSIEQKTPLIRIKNKFDPGFYLDTDGEPMSFSRYYTADVPIVTLNKDLQFSNFEKENFRKLKVIPTDPLMKSKQLIHDIYNIGTYFMDNPFWKSQIVQVHFENNDDIVLIPRVGKHVIKIGNANNLEDKFNNLMTFYNEGLSKTGWNEYTEINIKYNNQVICKKR